MVADMVLKDLNSASATWLYHRAKLSRVASLMVFLELKIDGVKISFAVNGSRSRLFLDQDKVQTVSLLYVFVFQSICRTI